VTALTKLPRPATYDPQRFSPFVGHSRGRGLFGQDAFDGREQFVRKRRLRDVGVHASREASLAAFLIFRAISTDGRFCLEGTNESIEWLPACYFEL
jgi:hypothetical protein